MPPRQKVTESDTHDRSLTPQHQAAVDLLTTGQNVTETAHSLGVERQTVSKWLHHNPAFMAALNQRRQELWVDMTDKIRALVPRALDTLAAALDGEESLTAAVHVLKASGLYGLVVPTGETDPALIAAHMTLAADERAHAEDNARIAIQRRGLDRMLQALAADPTNAGFPPPPTGQRRA